MDMHASAIRRFVGPLWAWWEKSLYLKHYHLLEQTQYDDSATIVERQERTVKELVAHAYRTVPFYREQMERAGLGPGAIKNLVDFQKLPLLTKADIRNHGEQLLSVEFARDGLHKKKTSGSTGTAVEVLVDSEAMQFKRACTLRSDQWSGWRLGEPIARVWGNPEYRRRGFRGRLRNTLLERARYLDTLKMSEGAMGRFAADLARRPASLIFGHAHSVFLFAEYLRKSAWARIPPRGIITTAMVLYGWQRRAIEDVFECKVTNRYGCEEVSLIACECEYHQGLHVNADGVYVEIIRNGRPARPGEAGAIVVTDLVNRAMPLIRYQVGDVGVMADHRCPCGRGLPLMKSIEGRDADYVVTEAGELISGISLTENLALHVPGIAQLQIIQESVERFCFRIVRDADFGAASIRRLTELVEERFGPKVTFYCDFVTAIPQEASGKYRFCISRVPNPFMRPREMACS